MTAVEVVSTARIGVSAAGRLLRLVAGLAGWVAGWGGRHWRYVAALVLVGVLGALLGRPRLPGLTVLAVVVPAMVGAAWARWWPLSYERWMAGPVRRVGWRRWARREWPDLARECGLSVQRTRRPWWRLPASAARSSKTPRSGVEERVWVHPRLVDVTTAGNTVTLLIRARRGQTVDDLEKGAAALAASGSAVSWRCRALSPSILDVALVMREELGTPRLAVAPEGTVEVDAVPMGRRQDGTPWRLKIRGRHTLGVGCSGAGKAGVLWGVCGGLAPAVRADLVRLWGIDLKKGVEIGMGRPLFHVTAHTVDTALPVMRRLLAVIDERGARMAGVTRLHEPSPGDPLHVLVIDELADLIGYSEPVVKAEATRLLSTILTQGRALGVVVVALVQDPRKDTVTMRGLFTQTIALRLRSADETRMVLGEGMAALAPAHRISAAAPGTAWVVEDDGTIDRVRADHWPDSLIRDIAGTYRAAVVGQEDVTPHPSPTSWVSTRSPRAPRAPRLPRPARLEQDDDRDDVRGDVRGSTGGEAA